MEWETPFAASIPKLLAQRGRRVVALCSSGPFWYGAGSVIAEAISAAEIVAVRRTPSSVFVGRGAAGLAAEEAITLGLHARPVDLLRPYLRTGARLIVLAARRRRAGAWIAAYLNWRLALDLRASRFWKRSAARASVVRVTTAAGFTLDDVTSPVALAIEAEAAPGAIILPRVAGLPDRQLFGHDRPTDEARDPRGYLSTLAPRGAGCCGISVPAPAAPSAMNGCWRIRPIAPSASRAREDRLATARANAQALGVAAF